MHRPTPHTNHIYHIYNRGVEKRDVFLDDNDYFRFVHDLFEFNDQNPAPNLNYYFNRNTHTSTSNKLQSSEVGLPKIVKREPRKLLVEIIAFCLMPNHFHLMIKQKVENGITTFMRKLGTGYTNYFNQKYERQGALFQGKYKIVSIVKEPHYIHLPYYIHLNPLDLLMPTWRKRIITNHTHAMQFLKRYRWSSLLDYIGIKNFPSVTQREFLLQHYTSPHEYEQNLQRWLKDIDKEISHISKITFE